VKRIIVSNVVELNKLKDSKLEYIYRGQYDSKWSLYPSIYRKHEWIEQQKLRLLERINGPVSLPHFLLTNFRILLKDESWYSRLEKESCPRDVDLALWCYIQHYGFGTPYIDWTKSFPVSLLFSLFSSVGEMASYDFSKELKVSEHTVSLYTLPTSALNMHGSDIYLVDPDKTGVSNKRIMAQRGLLLGMKEHYFMESSLLANHLTKYEIDHGLASHYLQKTLFSNKRIKSEIELAAGSLKPEEKFKKENDVIAFLENIKVKINMFLKNRSVLERKALVATLDEVTLIDEGPPGVFNKGQFITIGN
jgi:hypothetical protein